MMLDLVSGAPGQIVSAALFINSKSCSDIFTVTEVVLFPIMETIVPLESALCNISIRCIESKVSIMVFCPVSHSFWEVKGIMRPFIFRTICLILTVMLVGCGGTIGSNPTTPQGKLVDPTTDKDDLPAVPAPTGQPEAGGRHA